MRQLQHIPVVGCQRSGTTLVGQVLGAHPGSVLIDEDDRLYDWSETALRRRRSHRERLLFALCLLKARRKYLDPNRRVSRLGKLRPHVTHIVWKAPNLTYRPLDLAREFGPLRVVYLQRDIRDVVSSILRLTKVPILHNQLRLLRGAAAVREQFPELTALASDEVAPTHLRLAAIATIKMSLIPFFESAGHRVLPVRYEDLARDPKLWSGRLTRFAGLPTVDAVPSHATVLRGVAPGGTDRGRAVHRGSIQAWKRRLSERQATEIADLTPHLCHSSHPPSS